MIEEPTMIADSLDVTTEFILLSASNSVASARAALASDEGLVAAILDDQGQPFIVLTVADLENTARFDKLTLTQLFGNSPPVMVAKPNLKVEEFVDSPEFTRSAKAAIVFDGEAVTGILTEEVIEHYLAKKFGSTKGPLPSGVMLTGTPTKRRIVMYCKRCGERHELPYYNRRKPPKCQHCNHTLIPK